MRSISLFFTVLLSVCFLGCDKEEPPVIATAIQVTPESVNLNAGEQASLEIKTIPGGIAHWTLFDKPDWLLLSSEEGTFDGGTTVTLTTNAEGLEPETYNGTIIIASTAGHDSVDVSLYIEADPQVGLSATELNFPDGVSQNKIQINNVGLGALNYTLSSDISWLTITPGSGSLGTDESSELTFSVDRTYIVAGTYNGVITIFSNAAHGDKTIPVIIEVPEIATITSNVDTLGFNYFINDLQFTVKNDGNVTYDYSIISQNNLVTISNSTGSLEMSKNITISLTPKRDGLGTGVFIDVLTISNNKGESVQVKIGLLNFVEEKWLISGKIIDAKYDRNFDKIIAVSDQSVRVIDPVTKSETTIALSMTATCISVSPDGNFAAVGHNGSISYIDLNTKSVTTYSVGTAVYDVVLAGNGYVYIFPESGTYNTHIYNLNFKNGNITISGGTSYYTKAIAKLHPSGNYIYTIESMVSPSNITKYDITKGNASFVYASDNSYNFRNNLWFSETGDYLFAQSSDIMQPSTDPAVDLVPKSKLHQTERIIAMDHSVAANKIFAVFTDIENVSFDPTPEINVYDGTTFNYMKTIKLPKYLLADNNGGGALVDPLTYYGFFNSTGTEFYAITLDAENETSHSIITVPVN